VGTQHSSLSTDRWSAFSLDQQILMIGNEMHRAAKYLAGGLRSHLSKAYERVLALTDLTVAVQSKPAL
jgi:predicted metallopeptidase